MNSTDTRPEAPPLARSITATARHLGVGRTTVYELIKSGELRSVHINKRHLVPDSSSRQLIERLLAKADSEVKAA